MIDRYDALIALKDMNNDGKELLLQQVFEIEQFYAIKNEIKPVLMASNILVETSSL